MTDSQHNARAYIWHAFWAAIMTTVTEINTVLPALIISVGGTEVHVGILTAIMVGAPMLGQLIFAGMLSSRIYKKPYLLGAITLRALVLGAVGYTIYLSAQWQGLSLIYVVYAWMLLFTLSGAFAGVSYMDILGKSLEGDVRKRFLVQKQVLSGVGVLLSAFITRQILASLPHPNNYAVLFIVGAVSLFVASLGFWALRERPTRMTLERGSFFDIYRFIPKYLKEDHNLRNFVLLNNLAGFAVTLMPFYIVLARDTYTLDSSQVGNFLIVSIIGLILSNTFWSRLLYRFSYRGILMAWIGLGCCVPILALLLASTAPLHAYLLVFFLAGASISAQRISKEGILLEISDETTRALYTGINGAFNVTIALFPLISGVLILKLGYTPVFLLGSVAMFGAFHFARRIRCEVTRP